MPRNCAEQEQRYEYCEGDIVVASYFVALSSRFFFRYDYFNSSRGFIRFLISFL